MATENLGSIATLGELFARRVRETPHGDAYRQFDTASGAWRNYSWEQAAARVDEWRAAIHAMGLPQGARVAILLPNGVDTVCVDQACLALGLVPVPMHALDNPASIAYILGDCEVSLLVLSNRQQWQAICAVGASLPFLQRVIVMEDSNGEQKDATPGPVPVSHARDWLAAAETQENTGVLRRAVGAEDLAAIVYTSGTMGKPKGVMLTHRNILANIEAVLKRVQPQASDVFLSFLPLSHTFERTIGYYLPIAAGSCVAYARSVALLAEDFKAVRPTILVSVPRIYERFYAKLQEQLARSGPLAGGLFELAVAAGWLRFCRQQKMPHRADMRARIGALCWPMLRRTVADTVLAQFGGRLRVAVSGGAPMSPAVAQCFLGLGPPLLQGYGMTETSPVVAANALDDNWPHTVGRALDGVQVRIGEDSELQVRGPSVMKGYWNRPEDTARATTSDGWLRTGDQAVIEDGHIRISGRLKEIMVTSTGEKIAPADLELAITADPLFEQAMVIGENRPFIAALVVLNRSQWTKLAKELGLDAAAPESLHADASRELALQRIREATRAFPHYAVPRAVSMMLDPWTVENSLITPTLKLKRNALQARFGKEIEMLYANKPAAAMRKPA